MKKLKYVVSFCIILIGLLIIGESHIFYLDNFYNKYAYTTLYCEDIISKEEMLRDVLASSHKNQVEVFTFVRSKLSSTNTKYEVYGTSKVEKHINESSHIFEKKYNSIFLGSVSFEFYDIKDISNIKNQNEYYVIGEKNNIQQFKMELIDKYGGNHPKFGYRDKEAIINTIGVWLLIIFIILLFTVYDIISQKKESFIRVTMGESQSRIILENIFLDIIVFTFEIFIIALILSKYTYATFNFKISIIAFSIFIFINSLLYLSFFSNKGREVFSRGEDSKKILSLNYSLKFITNIITICIISSNIALSYQAYSFYKQKDFFESHKDYYYVKFMYKTTQNSDGTLNSMWEESQAIQETFFKEFFHEFNAISVKDYSENEKQQLFSKNKEKITANSNALKYLSTEIDELGSLKLDKDFYFILPREMKKDLKVIEELKSNISFNNEENFNLDYEVIFYNKKAEIVGINEDCTYGSNLIKNPCVIVNNISKERDEFINYLSLDQLYDVMYRISSEDEIAKYNEFIKKHNLEGQLIQKTNVLEKYEAMLGVAKRVIYINLIFSGLILLLEIIIINSIIMLEYKANAIELSVKKILGYNIFEKNRKVIMLTILTTISSIIIAIIINKIISAEVGIHLFVGGAFILFLELFIIIFNINKIEKSSIQNILKGGNL